MKKLLNENKYYVYAYLNPSVCGVFKYGKYIFEHEPFYIGKGSGARAYRLSKRNSYFKNKTKKIESLYGIKPIPIFIKEDMLEEDALKLEVDIIKIIGRHDKKEGPLTNLTDGGETNKGYIPSAEARKKMSKTAKKRIGSNNPFYGKHHSEELKKYFSERYSGQTMPKEIKEKISKSLKNKYRENGHPSTGKILSEDHKCKVSQSLKKHYKTHKHNSSGRKLSEKLKEKLSIIHKKRYEMGLCKLPSNIGKKHSDLTKEKMRKKALGRTHSEETRKKLSKIFTGRPGPRKGMHCSDKMKEAISSKLRLTYKITDLKGNQIIVYNLKEFCNENDLNYGSMRNVVCGGRKHNKGWKIEKVNRLIEGEAV